MTEPSSLPDLAVPPAPLPAPDHHGGSNFSRGMRETIECVAIAFALAFLFKTFEAEAFVIPTGSMAPTLMGRHKDVICPECGFHYTASGSDEAERDGTERRDPQSQVIACSCPNCRFPMSVDPLDESNAGRFANPSYSGDRIWVSKVPYHLMEPRRWDVIVFRFPEEAETYYIKRLVGLPNETVKINHGDIFTKAEGADDFVIQRKPPEKVRAMAQVVHDNDFVSEDLVTHGWPNRWQIWSEKEAPGDWTVSEDTRTYHTDGSSAGEAWIRYQHFVPSETNWREDRWPERTATRPQLITDFYAFNTRVIRRERDSAPSMLGLHWVGDLLLDCEATVENASGDVLLDLVKGGRHFRATIDVATGRATLAIDGVEGFHPAADTPVQGAGKYHLELANVDRQLLLWVNGKLMTFDAPTTYDDLDNDRPQAGGRDRGDLAPVGVGSRGAAVTVNHLRVLRDLYYIADRVSAPVISDFRYTSTVLLRMNRDELAEFFASPEQWDSPRAGNVFDQRRDVSFKLGPDQFFVLGDNSPASSDARLWTSQNFVPRDLLVGKALFVYWPHPLNVFLPFTNIGVGVLPNVPEMGFIR